VRLPRCVRDDGIGLTDGKAVEAEACIAAVA